jgi:hypothetical protein
VLLFCFCFLCSWFDCALPCFEIRPEDRPNFEQIYRVLLRFNDENALSENSDASNYATTTTNSNALVYGGIANNYTNTNDALIYSENANLVQGYTEQNVGHETMNDGGYTN